MYLCAMSQLFRLLCCMMSVAAFRLHVTSCSLACHAAVLALLAAVSARVACVSLAAILAPCRSCFGPLPPFWLHASTVLFRIGFVACHVMTLCVDHGSSATPQLELSYTCSSWRSFCVLLACHVLTCGACHVTTSGHVLESSCHCLLVMSCSGVLDM